MDMLTGNPAEIPAWLQAFAGQNAPVTGEVRSSPEVIDTLRQNPATQPAPGAQQAIPAAPPSAAQQVDPLMESLKRLIDLNTQAYQRVSSGQKPDRVTAILKDRAAEKPSWDEIGQAISQSFGSIAGSHPLQPKIVTVGEALNNIRANKILEAEKLAKVQIQDEQLELERRKEIGRAVADAVRLAQEQRNAAHQAFQERMALENLGVSKENLKINQARENRLETEPQNYFLTETGRIVRSLDAGKNYIGANGVPIPMPSDAVRMGLASGLNIQATNASDLTKPLSTKEGEQARSDVRKGTANIATLAENMTQLEQAPGAVGLRGLGAEKIGGVLSQIVGEKTGKAFSEWIAGVPQEQVATIRTRARLTVSRMLAAVTGDNSGRYTDRERAIAEETIKQLDPSSSFEQVRAAMRVALEFEYMATERAKYQIGVEPGALSNDEGIRAEEVAKLRRYGLSVEQAADVVVRMRNELMELKNGGRGR